MAQPSDPEEDAPIAVPWLPGTAPEPAFTRPHGLHNALPAGTRLHEFEILDLIGEGGFGIVYLAQDHSLGRHVAIKEYLPASLASRVNGTASVCVHSQRHTDTFELGLRSFVNEARLLARFDHPALLKVFRFWEANETAYMAMPYYEGETLRALMSTPGVAPVDEAWLRLLLEPIMDALDLMHASQCYHRDVAPDNILLQPNGHPVLLDFGAARRVLGDATQALTVILKAGFAPIEQYAQGTGVEQGPWTDIYALGAVVYFIITGRPPPPSVARIVHDDHQPLVQAAAGRYSLAFLQGIDRCLEVRGSDRPQSIAQMREILGFKPLSSAAPSFQTVAPPSQEALAARPPAIDDEATVAYDATAAVPSVAPVPAAAPSTGNPPSPEEPPPAPRQAPATKQHAPAPGPAPGPRVAAKVKSMVRTSPSAGHIAVLSGMAAVFATATVVMVWPPAAGPEPSPGQTGSPGATAAPADRSRATVPPPELAARPRPTPAADPEAAEPTAAGPGSAQALLGPGAAAALPPTVIERPQPAPSAPEPATPRRPWSQPQAPAVAAEAASADATPPARPRPARPARTAVIAASAPLAQALAEPASSPSPDVATAEDQRQVEEQNRKLDQLLEGK